MSAEAPGPQGRLSSMIPERLVEKPPTGAGEIARVIAGCIIFASGVQLLDSSYGKTINALGAIFTITGSILLATLAIRSEQRRENLHTIKEQLQKKGQ